MFNDTYTLLDPELALPTHIVEYQLDVDEVLPRHSESSTAPVLLGSHLCLRCEARKKAQAACDICGQGRAVVYSPLTNLKVLEREPFKTPPVDPP